MFAGHELFRQSGRQKIIDADFSGASRFNRPEETEDGFIQGFIVNNAEIGLSRIQSVKRNQPTA